MESSKLREPLISALRRTAEEWVSEDWAMYLFRGFASPGTEFAEEKAS